MKRKQPLLPTLAMRDVLPFIDTFLKNPSHKTLRTLRIHFAGVGTLQCDYELLGCPKYRWCRGEGFYSGCSRCSYIVNCDKGICVMQKIYQSSHVTRGEDKGLLSDVARAHLYLSEHRDLLATRPQYDPSKQRTGK